jgi:hypothetical protein
VALKLKYKPEQLALTGKQLFDEPHLDHEFLKVSILYILIK